MTLYFYIYCVYCCENLFDNKPIFYSDSALKDLRTEYLCLKLTWTSQRFFTFQSCSTFIDGYVFGSKISATHGQTTKQFRWFEYFSSLQMSCEEQKVSRQLWAMLHSDSSINIHLHNVQAVQRVLTFFKYMLMACLAAVHKGLHTGSGFVGTNINQ